MTGYFNFLHDNIKGIAQCITLLKHNEIKWRLSLLHRKTWIELMRIYYSFKYLNFDCIRNKHIYAYAHTTDGIVYVHCVSCGHVVRESE